MPQHVRAVGSPFILGTVAGAEGLSSLLMPSLGVLWAISLDQEAYSLEHRQLGPIPILPGGSLTEILAQNSKETPGWVSGHSTRRIWGRKGVPQ